MNAFRLAGDLAHLVAIVILLIKMWRSRSVAGISGRSQILFVLVFVSRYVDLFTNFVSVYNSSMKVIYIAASVATVFLMFYKFKATYDRNHDTFRVEFLLLPCAVLALIINHEFAVMEILWTFSIYLEAVAILPQLFMLSKTGEAETITSHYLFALGSYRALYIFNWVYRYYSEDFYDPIAIVAGIVQTILYADFFYLYVTRGNLNKLHALCLPLPQYAPPPQDGANDQDEAGKPPPQFELDTIPATVSEAKNGKALKPKSLSPSKNGGVISVPILAPNADLLGDLPQNGVILKSGFEPNPLFVHNGSGSVAVTRNKTGMIPVPLPMPTPTYPIAIPTYVNGSMSVV